MQFPLLPPPPPGLNKYPCLEMPPHPTSFCSQAFVHVWGRDQDPPPASPGTPVPIGSCAAWDAERRQEVTAGCAPHHRAWGHPMRNLGGLWPPRLPPHCRFLPIPRSYSWDRSWSIVFPPGTPPSAQPAGSAHGQGHQLVPPPGTPPGADLHPAPMGTPQVDGHQLCPNRRNPPRKSPSRNCRDHWPQEPIRWLFIYILKATLITPWGGITSVSFFLGQKNWWKPPL